MLRHDFLLRYIYLKLRFLNNNFLVYLLLAFKGMKMVRLLTEFRLLSPVFSSSNLSVRRPVLIIFAKSYSQERITYFYEIKYRNYCISWAVYFVYFFSTKSYIASEIPFAYSSNVANFTTALKVFDFLEIFRFHFCIRDIYPLTTNVNR